MLDMERQEHRDDDMLTKVELGAALNVSTRTIDRWIAEGTGPPYIGSHVTDCAGAGATSARGSKPAASPASPAMSSLRAERANSLLTPSRRSLVSAQVH